MFTIDIANLADIVVNIRRMFTIIVVTSIVRRGFNRDPHTLWGVRVSVDVEIVDLNLAIFS